MQNDMWKWQTAVRLMPNDDSSSPHVVPGAHFNRRKLAYSDGYRRQQTHTHTQVI